MIKQWKGKGGDSLRVDLSIILHHIPPLGLSLLFLSSPFSFSYFFLFVFLISKRKREGRNKGERIDKEECHLLCVLFCLSLSLSLSLSLLYSSVFYSFLCSSH